MKVFVVITEWNRGYDFEGGFTLEGVYASKKAATAAKKARIKHYKGPGFELTSIEDDEDDWAFDIHIEEAEVQS